MTYSLSKYVEKIFETPSVDFSEWFGYYNYDTLDTSKTKLLCNRAKFDGIEPNKVLSVEVGYYDLLNLVWHSVGISDSWNWQQGTMLQWLSDKEIIYNSSDNNHHISIIYDLELKSYRKISWPIYGILPNSRYSLSLDMERAHWCRAYHYASVEDKSKDGSIFIDDGIFLIDLDNNTKKRVISIQDIISLDKRPYFDKAKHWLEHIMINHDGSKFCFLHRFSPVNNVYKYHTRLIIADAKSFKLDIIPNWEIFQWSHFGWNHNDFAIYTYPCKSRITDKLFEIKKGEQNNQKISYPKRNKTISLHSLAGLIESYLVPRHIDQKIRGRETYY